MTNKQKPVVEGAGNCTLLNIAGESVIRYNLFEGQFGQKIY